MSDAMLAAADPHMFVALPPGAMHCFMTGFGLISAALVGFVSSVSVSGAVALLARLPALRKASWLPFVPLGALAVPIVLAARLDAREMACFVDDIGINSIALVVLAIDVAIPAATLIALRRDRAADSSTAGPTDRRA